MIEPPTPEDETDRQAALDHSHALQANPQPFDVLTELARSIFNVPISLVSLVDRDRQYFLSHSGIDAQESPRRTSFCGHVLLEPDILVIEDALTDERFHDNPFVIDAPNVRFYAGVPIKVDGYTIGSFCVIDSKPRSFSQKERDALKLLGQAVEQQIALERSTITDMLTNLLNRQGLQQVGQKMIAAAERNLLMTAGDRHAASLTAAFLDLDGFKRINDTYGHNVGNIALQDFARVLQSVNREGSSLTTRFAGDEFIVLMEQADRTAAEKMLQRFDAALATYNAQETRYQLRYSVGIAEWQKGMKLEQLIHAADEAMYLNKAQNKAS